MNNGRSIKLDLAETDSLCVRSVCRNTQVKYFFFLIDQK